MSVCRAAPRQTDESIWLAAIWSDNFSSASSLIGANDFAPKELRRSNNLLTQTRSRPFPNSNSDSNSNSSAQICLPDMRRRQRRRRRAKSSNGAQKWNGARYRRAMAGELRSGRLQPVPTTIGAVVISVVVSVIVIGVAWREQLRSDRPMGEYMFHCRRQMGAPMFRRPAMRPPIGAQKFSDMAELQRRRYRRRSRLLLVCGLHLSCLLLEYSAAPQLFAGFGRRTDCLRELGRRRRSEHNRRKERVALPK